MPTGTLGFFTVAPDGTITADFSGHITALGLDMAAGTAPSPPGDRQIRWHLGGADVSLPTVVAHIAYSTAVVTQYLLKVTAPTAAQQAIVQLWAETNSRVSQLSISQVATPGSASNNIQFNVDGGGAIGTLMDATKASSFLQLKTVQAQSIVSGVFTGAGAIFVVGTGGWTVVRNALGDYTVSYTVPFAVGANVVPLCTIFQGAGVTDVTQIFNTSFRVLTFNLAGGPFDPTGIMFHAIGSI